MHREWSVENIFSFNRRKKSWNPRRRHYYYPKRSHFALHESKSRDATFTRQSRFRSLSLSLHHCFFGFLRREDCFYASLVQIILITLWFYTITLTVLTLRTFTSSIQRVGCNCIIL